ncbi:hypothetical protein [Piscinibacter sakaiensis]|uniref:hypothetical protein n=1 Tax=Piscinibacter sakaiensis TaxID=1547922 RepID=UPI003AB01509
MQARYPAAFDREMGCTEAEWLRWLPGAVGGRAVDLRAGAARVAINGGALDLSWQQLAPRRIALMAMPVLAVKFRFSDIADAERQTFMRYFDLYTQRGGG